MTTTYLKEISTGTIHRFDEKSSPSYPELFIPATQIEIDELLLNEAKTQKHQELIEAYNIAISKKYASLKIYKAQRKFAIIKNM